MTCVNVLKSVLLACAIVVAPNLFSAEYVWIEGEAPTASSVKVEPSACENAQYLSGGKWLSYAVPPTESEAKVPKDGATFDYEFQIATPGTYQVWDRIGFESIRTAFQWRIDEAAAWNDIKGDELTTDLMRGGFFCEISWLKLGQAELTAGKHTLHFKVSVTYKTEKDVKKPNGVNFTADAFALTLGDFHPHSKFKPDEAWQTENDKKAAAQIFNVAAPKNPGERVNLSLSGLWEITRFDEGAIDDRTGPIKAPPKAEDCIWMGIDVPSDRNTARPDLVMCHRYFYRCKLNVPAELKGSSFCLHLPLTSMITTVFVNGELCGSTHAALAYWECDISKAIKPGAANEIWVGIKDTYYAKIENTRSTFHVPTEHWVAQWTTEHFDFPIAGHLQNGILLEPTLTVSGGVYAADVFAMSSVKNKTLTLETTLRNTTGEDAALTLNYEIVPLAGGAPEKTFAPVQATVPAGKELVIKPNEKWENPKLWWPDAPNQYLAVTKVSLNGKIVDTTQIKFGFREWEWEGIDFKLNGVPWHGRADTTGGSIASLKAHSQNMVRLWGSPLNVTEKVLDEHDAEGMPARWTGTFDGEGGAYGQFYGGQPLFERYIDQTAAWIKAHRNHPSIFIWSIENEITFINARNWGKLPIWEPWAKKCWETVRVIDPTRPVMVDGGRALMDNSLPVYGGHYEEGDGRTYPDESYTLTHLMNDHGWAQPWPIDRNKPIFMGESFYVRGYPPAYFAMFGGEKAFLGRSESADGAGLMLKMLSEGYRWNNITYHFWAGGKDLSDYYNCWKDVAILSREWNWSFGSGTTVARTLKVFNDTHTAEPIDAAWQLKVKDQVVQDGKRAFNTAPGMAEQFEISFKVPEVQERTPAEFILTCSRGGKEVFRDVKPVAIIAQNGAAKPTIKTEELLVLDPNGSVKARLKERGVAFTDVAKFDDLPAAAKVVIIGKDALDARQSTDPKFQALAANGARVLILDQANPLHYLAVPADLEPAGVTGRIAFIENLQNPCFAGLDQQDFFTWSKDHVVYRNAYRKALRGATSLVQCDEELNCTALTTCAVNDGLIVLCQLVVGEKLATDPVAQRLFDNMLNYVAAYAPIRKHTAVAMAADRPEYKMLVNSGLQFDPATSALDALTDGKHEIVVAQATPETLHALAGALDKVKTFTNAGGTLMLWGLDEKGLADFNTIVGVPHMIRQFEMERVTLPAQRDPILSGLTSRDIVMDSAQAQNQWAGDRFAANDVYSSIVDVEDVAPFATIPGPEYWGFPGATPGFDHYPRNMFNGFTSADSWKYSFTIVTTKTPTATKWPLTFPQEQEFTDLEILFAPIFSPVGKLNLYFDADPTPVTLEIKGDWKALQRLPLPAPRKAKVLTLELADFEKKPQGDTLVGIDNMRLFVKRPADIGERVRPLLNIGGLVKYRMGQGCILLNNLRATDKEAVPVNAQKKQNIVSTLLRNLNATFAGSKTVVAGAGMAYTPVALDEKCNMFLTHDKGWFDARDFSLLPKGEQKFTGVTYLIRDFKTSPLPSCIMLASEGNKVNLPKEVKGIKVNAKADALFFLHTAFYQHEWNKPKQGDQTPPVIFKYVVHFADGSAADVPIRFKTGVGPWAVENPAGLKEAAVAWAAPFATGKEQAVAYQFQWDNPKPEAVITEVDMVYTGQYFAAPVLLGLTAGTAAK